MRDFRAIWDVGVSHLRQAAGLPITESFTIRYRRPEAPWSVVRTVVPGAEATKTQVDRLKALGYSIIDVEPAAPPPLVAMPERRHGTKP